MAAEFQPGVRVAWKYGTGEATGCVVEKLTEDRKLGTKTFKSSMDDPRYLVRSDKSGKDAIRRPETLRCIGEADNHEPSVETATKDDEKCRSANAIDEEDGEHADDAQ